MRVEIKVEHAAIEIGYDEWSNRWQFIVGGKEYAVESLRLAKEKIDAVIKAIELKGRKAFDPISAFSYSGEHGRITSLEHADSDKTAYRRGLYVRFKRDEKDSGASKTDVTTLVKDTPNNRTLFGRLKELRAEETKLRDELVYFKETDMPNLGE